MKQFYYSIKPEQIKKKPTVEELLKQGKDIKITKCPKMNPDQVQHIGIDFWVEVIGYKRRKLGKYNQ